MSNRIPRWRRAAVTAAAVLTGVAALTTTTSTASAAPSGKVRMIAMHSNKCLTADSSTQLGSRIAQQPCQAGNLRQLWEFKGDGFGNFQIRNAASQMCMQPESLAASLVVQRACNPNVNEQFFRESMAPLNGNIVSRWRHLSSGLYLDVSGGTPNNGDRLITFPFKDVLNQRFDHIVVSP